MARKLDASQIERERNKNRRANRKEEARQNLQAEIERNQRGERKMTYIPPAPKGVSAQGAPALRAAAYIRVSTQEEAQMGSFEIQKIHFLDVIRNNPRYELAGLYCDEGISGTQVHKRVEFQRMIEDAKAGKIGIILTKSIARFGRNIVDFLSTLRTLDALNPPVPVIFETDGINTADGNKLLIPILAAIAELESYQKSEAVKAGIRWRMREGIYKFAVANTLGYYRDYAGIVKIEPAEAEIVRYIYASFLEGSSPDVIAESLTAQGIKSPKGMEQWRSATIRGILANEKYCGDVVYQKTYTKDYLTHKSARNHDVLGKYYWENIIHPSIVQRRDWEKTQGLLREKSWNKPGKPPGNLPGKFIIAKVASGALRSYYLLDAAWDKDDREKFIRIIRSLRELDE